jgi:hypothetical protein
MLEGALILLAGILIGMGARSLPGRRAGPKPPPAAVCGCGHHFSYHDPKTRACGYGSRPVVRLTSAVTEYGDVMRCPCLSYSGPEPLVTYYAPEIAGETGQ